MTLNSNRLAITNSSVISEIRFNSENNTLTVLFKNGSVYDYYNFDNKSWEELKKAESKGKYLKQIIEKKYKYKRIM